MIERIANFLIIIDLFFVILFMSRITFCFEEIQSKRIYRDIILLFITSITLIILILKDDVFK